MRIVLASLVAASFSLQPAVAADVKLLTTGAFKPVVTALVADYERQSGDKVTIVNDTAGALVRRIDGGETFDLVVLTPAAINDPAKAGKVGGGATNLARVGVGVVVKEGAPSRH